MIRPIAPVCQDKNHDDSVACCDSLTFEGASDWRLPTLDEVRSMFRNCPELQTGGACGLKTGCLDGKCKDAACDKCSQMSSQVPGKCFTVPEFQTNTDSAYWYWSADEAKDLGQFWKYNFCQARIEPSFGAEPRWVRCVH